MYLSHRTLATWYTQLAQQLEAGMTLRDALEGPVAGHALRKVTQQMADRIKAGGSTDDALRLANKVAPQADLLSLSAAAEAGRMPQVLRGLAARHTRLATAKFRMVLACIYPLGVAHVGLLLVPVTQMIDWQKGFQWSTALYLRELLLLLGPLWLLLGGVYVLARQHSPILRRVAAALPGTRGYLRNQSLSDLSFALGNFLAAGVPIGDAWATVGLTSRSPQLKIAAEAMAGVVERGVPPGRRLGNWSCFPPEFVAQYQTGENTGHLDQALIRMSESYQDTANRYLTFTTLLYPSLVFLFVAGMVVYGVLTMYAGYLRMLTKMAE